MKTVWAAAHNGRLDDIPGRRDHCNRYVHPAGRDFGLPISSASAAGLVRILYLDSHVRRLDTG